MVSGTGAGCCAVPESSRTRVSDGGCSVPLSLDPSLDDVRDPRTGANGCVAVLGAGRAIAPEVISTVNPGATGGANSGATSRLTSGLTRPVGSPAKREAPPQVSPETAPKITCGTTTEFAPEVTWETTTEATSRTICGVIPGAGVSLVGLKPKASSHKQIGPKTRLSACSLIRLQLHAVTRKRLRRNARSYA